MSFLSFFLYTLKIGKLPPDDFEEKVGLSGSTATVAIFLTNVLSSFAGIGVAFLISKPPRGKGIDVLPWMLAVLVLIMAIRGLAFWCIRSWVNKH